MTILLWGAGAIGGTIGAYLIRAKHDVVLVDVDTDHVNTMNQSGLHISGPIDDFTVPVTAYTPEQVTGTYQTILLCVKSQHTVSAIQQLRPHLADNGYVVSVQNGLNELVISQSLGAQQTLGAFVNFGADYLEAGQIHRANRATVVIGELDGHLSERVQALHLMLMDFDDHTQITDNIYGYLWGKMAYASQLFATALTNDPIADALAHPKHRPIYCELAREVLRIASTQQITLLGFDGFDPLAFTPNADIAYSERSLNDMVRFNRQSTKTHSGVWRDLAIRKRPTEVDVFQPMLTLAYETGIATPLLRKLVDLIHAIEKGEHTQSYANMDILLTLLKGENT